MGPELEMLPVAKVLASRLLEGVSVVPKKTLECIR